MGSPCTGELTIMTIQSYPRRADGAPYKNMANGH